MMRRISTALVSRCCRHAGVRLRLRCAGGLSRSIVPVADQLRRPSPHRCLRVRVGGVDVHLWSIWRRLGVEIDMRSPSSEAPIGISATAGHLIFNPAVLAGGRRPRLDSDARARCLCDGAQTKGGTRDEGTRELFTVPPRDAGPAPAAPLRTLACAT